MPVAETWDATVTLTFLPQTVHNVQHFAINTPVRMLDAAIAGQTLAASIMSHLRHLRHLRAPCGRQSQAQGCTCMQVNIGHTVRVFTPTLGVSTGIRRSS